MAITVTFTKMQNNDISKLINMERLYQLTPSHLSWLEMGDLRMLMALRLDSYFKRCKTLALLCFFKLISKALLFSGIVLIFCRRFEPGP